ncbi:glycosyltransferase family 2 protein [Oscillatoria sp. FACHB-1406]|uniref:glycosyltransferase family 2 protein n=1 Tax=Oscillatoria sp. FACHB-1406 TaxID=2692846 RepID=UPI00168242E9|nr:glycosyltransferase family 2 protein [Oscillatoria sp. FACHB-1406]MBD2577593.1 glycosyltransferase family 2 protein [Oscillatoria sp. FACHB-1406]
MKVSVVIPTYNRLPFLQRAVASALQQTSVCEVVIVDDGSNDGTEEYAKSLGHQVIYHRNSQNLGHSKSVNAGVAAASGEWIKFIDDDDYLAPNCVEVMAKAIASHPQAAICSCQAFQVDTDGKELNCTAPVGTAKAFYILQEDIHYGMLIEMLPFGTPVQVAVKKAAFIESGGWNSDFDGDGDDIESWVRIAQFGDAIFINQALAYRTIWRGNCSGQLSLKQRLNTNISIKQKIYKRVHPKYASLLPKSEDVCAFLELHWGLVGLKRGKLIDGLKLIYPSLLSATTFAHLAKVIYSRKAQNKLASFEVEDDDIYTAELHEAKLPWMVSSSPNLPDAVRLSF